MTKHIIFIGCLLGFMVGVPAYAGTLTITPAAGSYNQPFTIQIAVDSEGESVNAFAGTLLVPSDTLRVDSISSNNTIVDFWVTDPQKSGTSNSIRFEGTTFFPGHEGSNGPLFSVAVTPVQTGVSVVTIADMEVLAADGAGTDVSSAAATARYSVATTVLTEESEGTDPAIEDSVEVVPQRLSPPIITNAAMIDTSTIEIVGEASSTASAVVVEYWQPEKISCEPAIKTTLAEGDTGVSVSALQLYLAWRFQLPLGDTVTGYFGTQTKNAVRNVQLEAGITADAEGVVGSATQLYINKETWR